MRKFHCIAAVLLALAAPADAAQKAHAIAHLKNLEGKPVGSVDFAAVNRGVLVTFDLHDLPPGAHAIHLHTSGNCDPKTGFTAAGPILTLIPGKQHGYLAEGGPEAGDLPNQFAGADGHLHASAGQRLRAGQWQALDLRPRRGRHHRRCPGRRLPHPALGNAGDRIACGVVMRTAGPKARRKKPH